AVQLADLVLTNLEPFGRSRLYSQQLESDLVERVNNIDPEADHYQSLNVAKDASSEEISQAFVEQKAILEKENTPEAATQLTELRQA
ncbi:hypothetical protein, partial [Pseudomonas sp. Kh7]|uniref:hypothetical protein n=1 Tax=Pseudomonas sp. Kh7 TaxID=2093743 RepID=UPI0015B3E850